MDENAGWEKARKDGKVIDDRSFAQHGTADLTGIFRRVTIEKGPDSSAATGSSSSSEHSDGIRQIHLDRDNKESVPVEEDLSFTQLFQSVSVKPDAEPLRPPTETATAQQKVVADNQQQSASVYSNSEPPYEPVHGISTSPSSAGEFTAMFQTIRSSPEVFEFPGRSPYLSNSRSQEQNPIGGGFTQLLRTLSDDQVSTTPFDLTSGATEKPALREPGEFTQIVARSEMREAMLREEHAPAASDPPMTSPRSGENLQVNSGDLQSPSVVAPAFAMPIPSASNLPLSEPTMLSPEASNVTGGATSVDRWQKHLPLLIMVNLAVSLFTLALIAITLLRQH